MTLGMRVLLAVIVVGILLAVWVTRISITGAGAPIAVNVLDRWAGTVYRCIERSGCVRMYPPEKTD
jgi:hypothetical protein